MESILIWQRKCENALYSLVTLGARRPVRHLASVAMAKIISNGYSISIYSRASSLQGFLSDGKQSDPQRVAVHGVEYSRIAVTKSPSLKHLDLMEKPFRSKTSLENTSSHENLHVHP